MKRMLRFLGSTRLSAYLIMALLVFFVLGLVIPQKKVISYEEYMAWQEQYPLVTSVLEFLGFLEIYTSPISIGLLALFFVNLLLVLESRLSLILKRCDKPKPGPVRDERAVRVDMGGRPPDEAVSLVRERLKGFSFRESDGSFAAVKNRFGPLGLFLFHVSFLFLLMGGLTIFYTRSSGTAKLTEGETFMGRPQDYRPLQMPKADSPPSLRFEVLEIEPTFEAGTPVDITATLAVQERDGVHERRLRVNHPYQYENTTVLIKDVDVSPLVQLRDLRGNLYEDAFISLNVMKGQMDSYIFPSTEYRVDFEFFPDYVNEDGLEYSRSMQMNNPVYHVYLYKGKRKTGEALMRVGQRSRLGDMWLTIAEQRYWGEFIIVKEAGSGLLVFGIAIGILGLVWRYFFVRVDVRGSIEDGALTLAARNEVYRERERMLLDSLKHDLESHEEGGSRGTV
jgi:cytochrome c biogenesis protein ResB